MHECTEGFEIVRNTKTEVGLDASQIWSSHLIEKHAGRRMFAIRTWLHGETRARAVRVVRQRFGDDVQNFWKSMHMVCIQKIC